MKKIVPILLVGILVISGLGAVAIPNEEQKILVEKDLIELSSPILKEDGEYLSIEFDQSNSNLMDEGKPILPIITKTYTFPIGSKIPNVEVNFEIEEYNLNKKIQPSPKPMPLTMNYNNEKYTLTFDENTYSSSNYYPEKSYDIKYGAGLQNNEHVVYLNINCYPQYSPATDTIKIPENIDIKIEYILPEKPLFTADEYDLLIITNEQFVSQLQPLVNHKNSIGINSIIESTDTIYSSYNGRDEAEDIKLRIKDAIEEWGIKYVLLVGGRVGQTFDWYVASRTTNNDDGAEPGYESDLYFADIYKFDGETLEFEDWDSNGNGVFAEWSHFVGGKDLMDFYPDVSVGRLPVSYSSEVDIMVNKIIDYETNADDSWFKNAVVISGDTFPPSRGGSPGWNEGEMECEITVDLLEDIGFTMNKLFLSIPGAWSGPEDVSNAFNQGAGFVHFAGHSNPASWGNHPPDDQTHEFIIGVQLRNMMDYSSNGEYPVVILGGCHSAQYDVTMMNLIVGVLEDGLQFFAIGDNYGDFWNMAWVPRDISSWYVLRKDGGSIASIGNTGYGYGYVNQHATAGLGGWIEPRFFDAYANQSKTILGETHTQAIIDYINIIGSVNEDNIDRKTIEQWVLLGDPSLKLGGV